MKNFKIIIKTILFFLVLSFYCFSQVKHNAKFNHIFKLAEKNYDFGYYKDALNNYMIIYNEDSNDVDLNYKIAMCHYFEKHYPDSILHFLEKDTSSSISEVHLLLGKLYHQKFDFEKAKKQFNIYKNFSLDKREFQDQEIDRLIDISNRAALVIKNPHKYVIENMGQKINTVYNEYVPLINAEGTLLFFTSKRPGSTGNLQDIAGNYFEDIYFTTKIKGAWTDAKNIGLPINTNDHDACVGLSADGIKLLVYRPSKDKVHGDIYQSDLKNEKWLPPIKLGNFINSKLGNETSACASNDLAYLFFSSDKPGGFGGKDIYFCKKLPNGNWSLSTNLGPVINSVFDEDAPFMSADNRYLYFSSKGHETIGEYDIFKSEFLIESNTWSKPQNMGYPINSVGDDIFFVLSRNGYQGYFSSIKKSGFGGEDIYSIDMYYNETDIKVRIGYVLDSEHGNPLKSKITLIENDTKQVIGNFASNNLNGKFIYTVNPFKTYTAIVETEGYQQLILNIEMISIQNENEDLKIELVKKKE